MYIYIYIYMYIYGFSYSLSLSRSFFSGGDALTFVADFDLTKSDYADLAKLYDNFQDAQDAACVWIKENPDKWSVDLPIHTLIERTPLPGGVFILLCSLIKSRV